MMTLRGSRCRVGIQDAGVCISVGLLLGDAKLCLLRPEFLAQALLKWQVHSRSC